MSTCRHSSEPVHSHPTGDAAMPPRAMPERARAREVEERRKNVSTQGFAGFRRINPAKRHKQPGPGIGRVCRTHAYWLYEMAVSRARADGTRAPGGCTCAGRQKDVALQVWSRAKLKCRFREGTMIISSVRARRTAMLRAAFTGTRPNTCKGTAKGSVRNTRSATARARYQGPHCERVGQVLRCFLQLYLSDSLAVRSLAGYQHRLAHFCLIVT